MWLKRSGQGLDSAGTCAGGGGVANLTLNAMEAAFRSF